MEVIQVQGVSGFQEPLEKFFADKKFFRRSRSSGHPALTLKDAG